VNGAHRQRGIELIGSGKGAAHGPIVIELGFDLPKDALAHIPATVFELDPVAGEGTRGEREPAPEEIGRRALGVLGI